MSAAEARIIVEALTAPRPKSPVRMLVTALLYRAFA
jgi:uncharacterized protein involved in exopolysaccharide biosynthesis